MHVQTSQQLLYIDIQVKACHAYLSDNHTPAIVYIGTIEHLESARDLTVATRSAGLKSA